MSEKFQNKYRTSSFRLQPWNYNSEGLYFITICTKSRQHYFGKIENAEMQLSELGKIAETEWSKTPEIRPDMNLQLFDFVVMPNHFHAIISIGKNEYNAENSNEFMGSCSSRMHPAATTTHKFGPQSKNLASIMRGYKSAITQYARINNIEFAWQSLYYDHIIRNDESFFRISDYIQNNPKNWEFDKLNGEV